MKRTYVKDLKEGECLVKGYIEKIRDQKTMQFVVLRDVTGAVQITIIKQEQPKLAEIVSRLTTHSFIDVFGECKNTPQVKLGGKEILPSEIIVQSIAESLPITPESAQDIRFDYRWIDLRDEKKVFIFKMWNAFEKLSVDYFLKKDFIQIHTPKITALSSEGGSEVFEIKNYFGQKTYLTQSPQLYKQMSVIAGLDRTFEIGEYFRANPSFTSRHHCEFTGLDIEVAHIESHHDIMDLEEDWLKYVLKEMKKELGAEYSRLYGQEMISIGEEKWPRIPLLDVYKILKTEVGYEVPRELKGDMDPEGERLISKYAKEKYGTDFMFITDFPFKARAFYTKKHEDNPELGKCYDLFYNGLEITSGAQREHRYEELKENIIQNGIDPKNMKEYLEFFRYGAPPHGGFGLGIGRTLTKIFGFANVREVDFIHRGPTRFKP